MNLSKLISVALFGARATALFTAVACLAGIAGAQSQPAKLSPNQLAALARLRVTRSTVNRVGTPTLPPPTNGMVITPASATVMATMLLGPGGPPLSGVPTFQGAAAQSGTFTNAPALLGITSGVILSSGSAADARFSYVGIDLPSTDLGQPGYAPLGALIGKATQDAAVLQFSFVPTFSVMRFRYVFASAEYPNYLLAFTDPMALFVNGTGAANNAAVLPVTPPVGVTSLTVNAATNPSFFNKYNTAGDQLIYGGETNVLTANVNVNPGVVNTLTFSVADAVDGTLDSAIFIEPGSFTPPDPAGVPALSPLAFAVLGIVLLLSGALLLRGLPAAGPHGRRD